MTIKDMQNVLKVADDKSITKAAAKLYISQPSLSQSIAKTEKECGVLLFERCIGGMKLTEAGEAFTQMARTVINAYEGFEKEVATIVSPKKTQLIVGIPPRQSTMISSALLLGMRKSIPDMAVKVLECSSNDIEQGLISGDIDIGVMHLPIVSTGIRYEIIHEDKLCILLRKGSTLGEHAYYKEGFSVPFLDVKELRNEPLALTHPGQRSRMICEAMFKKAGFAPNVIQESSGEDTPLKLVAAGIASAIVNTHSVNIKDSNVYAIDGEKYNNSCFFIVAYRNGCTFMPIVRSVIMVMMEFATNEMPHAQY